MHIIVLVCIRTRVVLYASIVVKYDRRAEGVILINLALDSMTDEVSNDGDFSFIHSRWKSDGAGVHHPSFRSKHHSSIGVKVASHPMTSHSVSCWGLSFA